MSDKPTTEQMLDCLLSWGERMTSVIGRWTQDDADMWTAVRARLSEFDALKAAHSKAIEIAFKQEAEINLLKAEVIRWQRKFDDENEMGGTYHDLWKKAEAELAAAKPLIQAVLDWQGWQNNEAAMRLDEAVLAYRAAKEKK